MSTGKKRRLVIAVDFDGVLTSTRGLHWPAIGPIRRPMAWLVDFMQRCGHEIILNTCRSGAHLENAIIMLASHGRLLFDYYNENSPSRIEAFGGDARKISADYYIDDKACFSIYLWALYVAFQCYIKSPLRRLRRNESTVSLILEELHSAVTRKATREGASSEGGEGEGKEGRIP